MFFFCLIKRTIFTIKKYFLFLLTPPWVFTDQLANQKVVNNNPYEILLTILSMFYYKKLNHFFTYK